jgi:hypothetical protein
MANIHINVHKSHLLWHFFLLWAHLMANILINVHRSHLLWQFLFAVGTPYGKYPHQCSQVPSTLALFCNCVHTLLQIFTSMFTSPIYFGSFSLLCAHLMANIHIDAYRSHLLLQFFFAVCTPYGKYSHQCLQVPSTFALFCNCAHTLCQIFTTMFTGLIYFCSFSLLCAHLMANIHINVHRSRLLWQFLFAVGTPYGKYQHQCSQVPSTLALFCNCVHTLWQIFTSMFTGPIYFGSFSLLCAHLMANIHIDVYRSHLLLHLFCNCAHTLLQIYTSMFTGLIYFCSFSFLCAHIMANIPINAYGPHLL